MTDSAISAITFDNVSKKYSMFGARFSLKDIPAMMFKRGRRDNHAGEIWALAPTSLQIRKGETVGIIGPNGAGKTTTLQLISRIIQPTTGQITVGGRVSALIHLGAGFHPDLTGRENIYVNGSILGMTRQEIEERFDKIVAFSGLKDYLDMPVKRYSSGMFARLGFAVAAHSDPDILIVDEVLSVGDAEFQTRCFDRMKNLRDSDTTIIFVSHYLPAVQAMCKRAIYLDHGHVRADGEARLVIQEYQTRVQMAMIDAHKRPSEPVGEKAAPDRVAAITDVRMFDSNGVEKGEFMMREDLRIRMRFVFYRKTKNPVFSVGIERPDGIVCCSTATNETIVTGEFVGEGVAEVCFPRLELVPGVYAIACWITDSENIHAYDSTRHTLLKVITDLPIDSRFGVFVPQTRWQVNGAPYS